MKKLPILESFPETPRTSFDNSMLETYKQCPRLYWLRYVLNVAPVEKSYPITFGVAYHKYREVIERAFLTNPDGDVTVMHQLALKKAFDVFGDTDAADPPLDHKHSFLTRARLLDTIEQGFEYWLSEKRQGDWKVLEPEQAFELQLPSGAYYGGRMDQVLEWSSDLWVRDFKTTSRMGRTYAHQFEPNAQFDGYIWGAQETSGRRVKGVIVETVYNTKNIGPQHSNFLSTRTPFSIEEWLEDTEAAIADVNRDQQRRFYPKRTSACMNYGGCYFRDFCKMSNWASRESWLHNHTTAKTWDFMAENEGE